MKFSTEEKPAPTWKVPVGRSPTSKLMIILSGAEPCSVEDVDVIEVAERGDALLRVLQLGLAEDLPFLDLHLAAHDPVARLRVALDLDALHAQPRGRGEWG